MAKVESIGLFFPSKKFFIFEMKEQDKEKKASISKMNDGIGMLMKVGNGLELEQVKFGLGWLKRIPIEYDLS